jgi:cytidyltransferase-like protein
MTQQRRIGVLGGTFDPVHLGHLGAAEVARSTLALDEVLVVPSHIPPHRLAQPDASGYHRFAMVALAVASARGLAASDVELVREGRSYTATTLRGLHRRGFSPSQLSSSPGPTRLRKSPRGTVPGRSGPRPLRGDCRPGFPWRRSVAASGAGIPHAYVAGSVEPDRGSPGSNLDPPGGSRDAGRVIHADSGADSRAQPLTGLVPRAVEIHIYRHGPTAPTRSRPATIRSNRAHDD